MSADLLREAAALLRLQAEAATPGAWIRDSNAIRPAARSWDAVALTHGPRSLLDAAYIATTHPGVGLALADWLDSKAEVGHYTGCASILHWPYSCDCTVTDALAVARAILARQP